MNHRLRILPGIFSFLILIMYSCHKEDTGLRSINLDMPVKSEKIQIEQLFENPKLIKLDTTNSIYLEPYFSYWLGEKHLIIITSSKILQFNSEGKFIRLLKEKGRGPGEFSRICCFDVDESSDILYYSDYKNKRKLTLIDLVDGREISEVSLLENIELDFSGLKIMPDGRLLCFNSLYEESLYLYYFIEPSGEITDTVRKPEWMREYPPASYLTNIGYFDDKISFLSGITDTLFRVNSNELLPALAIDLDARYHYDDMPSGFFPTISFENSSYLLIKKREVESMFDKGLNRLTRRLLDEYGLFLYLKKEKILTEVEGLYLKSLKLPDFIYIMHSSTYASILIDISVLISWREDLLSDDQAAGELPDYLLDIIMEVDEIDNSYILVGKL